jgi:hypothetical protein
MRRQLLGVPVVGVALLLLGLASPAGAAVTTTTAPHTSTTTRPHTATTTAPHTSTTTRPHTATTTARAHRKATRRRTRTDFEVVLGITRTRPAAERLVRAAERHDLRPSIETEGRGRRHRFEVELPGFRTRAAAERELRVVRRDGFRRAFVERS